MGLVQIKGALLLVSTRIFRFFGRNSGPVFRKQLNPKVMDIFVQLNSRINVIHSKSF
jgi:hypothetical protein